MSVLPGLVISPLAGALLDRHGCTRLILLDFAVSAATMVLLTALALTLLLASWMLVGVVALNSLTSPFTRTGARSLIPRLVPRGLWDRANAVDAASYAVSSILGPVLAGLLVTWTQGEGALLTTSAVFGLASLCLVGLRDQAVAAPGRGSLAAEARAGLGYVLTNPSLRGLVLVSAGYNFSHGVLSLVLPMLVLQRLGLDAALVGALFGAFGFLIVYTIFGVFRRSEAPAPFTLSDLVGRQGSVAVSIPAGRLGSVYVRAEGQTREFSATAAIEIPSGTPVVVTGTTGTGLVVAPAESVARAGA
jgi:membrane protein implicated in regulation of membrane protease activity